jgi:glycosyltransferase involved in cell wall biosynthesis
VVNDGGADLTPVVEQFADLEVKVVDIKSSLGPSGARNAGIDVAQTEYVAFLDDDDLLLPHRLESALTLLESGSDLVYCSMPVVTSRTEPGAAIDPLSVPESYDLPFDAEFLDVLNYIPPSAVVCRRPPSGARFDASLRVEEDWHFWLVLLHEHGYRFAHDPRVGAVYHRVMDVDSITSLVDDEAIIRLFADCYDRIIKQWPASTGSRVDTYREWMHFMYQTIYTQFESGKAPAPHWYERVVRVLSDGFHERIDEGSVREGLVEAVRSRP